VSLIKGITGSTLKKIIIKDGNSNIHKKAVGLDRNAGLMLEEITKMILSYHINIL
jgi:hypothetical protein